MTTSNPNGPQPEPPNPNPPPKRGRFGHRTDPVEDDGYDTSPGVYRVGSPEPWPWREQLRKLALLLGAAVLSGLALAGCSVAAVAVMAVTT